MYDIFSEVDRPQNQPTRFLVPHPNAWKNYVDCPWATSIIAIDPESENLVLCPVRCKRWGCEFCAQKKIRRLSFLTNGAQPNRMVTLTIAPGTDTDPKAAWERTSPLVPELMRIVRKVRNRECEYLRVCEIHKSGWPHYHCLLRSEYIPQAWLSETWAKLSGATQVDVRKVDNSFSSFRYLVKYLSKMHRLDWTDRHCSYSRKFFRPEDLEKIKFPERSIESRSDEHPWIYLSSRYPAEEIGVDDAGCYHLPHAFCGEPMEVSREDVGLDQAEAEPQPIIKKLRQRSAFAASGDPNANAYF